MTGVVGSTINLNGLISVDKKVLDLRGRIVLSRKYSKKIRDAATPLKALCDSDDRLALPILITDSFDDPKISLDTEQLMNSLETLAL
jgi:hypothetical protein